MGIEADRKNSPGQAMFMADLAGIKLTPEQILDYSDLRDNRGNFKSDQETLARVLTKDQRAPFLETLLPADLSDKVRRIFESTDMVTTKKAA